MKESLQIQLAPPQAGRRPLRPSRDRGPRPDRAGGGNKLKSSRCRIAIAIIIACLAGAAGVARANCDEDCKSEYVSALGECRSQYQTRQEDLEDLESCLADTKGEYDDCIDDCTSIGAGGVVACSSRLAAITLASVPVGKPFSR